MTNRFRLAGRLLSLGGILFLLSLGPAALRLVTIERRATAFTLPLSIFFFSLSVTAAILIVIGLWSIRHSVLIERRMARVGLYLCIASVACVGLAAIGNIVAQFQSGHSGIIFFIVYLISFPLSILGSLLLGIGIRHLTWLGWGRLIPFMIAGGMVLAFLGIGPMHVIQLTTLALSWAAFGVSMLLSRPVA